MREILAEAASAYTGRSYASALRYCAAWYQGRYGQPFALALPEAVVIQFIVDHLARSGKVAITWELPDLWDAALVEAGLKQRRGQFKLTTICHRIAVLSKAHQAQRVANPCEQPAVRHLMARVRRAAVKRGDRPIKKMAIAQPELTSLRRPVTNLWRGARLRPVAVRVRQRRASAQ
ncbi:hypothetical protein [Luteibacter rhizovicinus]|uniref:hypothetical protein n=1 Tax=Luteibacter rhizovicinus TaxID=242606 RepID=UPI0031B6A66D